MVGRKTFEYLYAGVGQHLPHGRIGSLVGTAHCVARLLEHDGQRRHADAADSHEMYVL